MIRYNSNNIHEYTNLEEWQAIKEQSADNNAPAIGITYNDEENGYQVKYDLDPINATFTDEAMEEVDRRLEDITTASAASSKNTTNEVYILTNKKDGRIYPITDESIAADIAESLLVLADDNQNLDQQEENADMNLLIKFTALFSIIMVIGYLSGFARSIIIYVVASFISAIIISIIYYFVDIFRDGIFGIDLGE